MTSQESQRRTSLDSNRLQKFCHNGDGDFPTTAKSLDETSRQPVNDHIDGVRAWLDQSMDALERRVIDVSNCYSPAAILEDYLVLTGWPEIRY
jgi:hypothetical protein